MTTTERIAKLTAESREHQARSYEIDAEIDRLNGDLLSAEFHDAMAASWRNEPGSEERKQRTYIRVQASRVADSPHVIEAIAESDRAAVRAEVARILAERDAAAEAEDAQIHASHEVAPVEEM